MPQAQKTDTPVKTIQEEKPERDVAVPKIKLRSQPISEYSIEAVEIMLEDKGFFDTNLNNESPGFSHQYEIQQDGKVVYDHASGLMWQQSGTTKYMTYKKAKAYIDTLNSQGFAGYRDWRLPTLEEAMSLTEPTKMNDDFYIDPKFDNEQRWIWTSDLFRASSFFRASSAWVVVFFNGSCVNFDFKGNDYVRAVR